MKVSFVSPKYWAIKLLPLLAVRSALQWVFGVNLSVKRYAIWNTNEINLTEFASCAAVSISER